MQLLRPNHFRRKILIFLSRDYNVVIGTAYKRPQDSWQNGVLVDSGSNLSGRLDLSSLVCHPPSSSKTSGQQLSLSCWSQRAFLGSWLVAQRPWQKVIRQLPSPFSVPWVLTWRSWDSSWPMWWVSPIPARSTCSLVLMLSWSDRPYRLWNTWSG